MNLNNLKKYYNNRLLNTSTVFCLDLLCSFVASMTVLQLVNIIVPVFDFGSKGDLLWLTLSFLSSLVSFRICKVYKAVIRYSTLRELRKFCVAVLGKELLLYISIASLSKLGFTSELLAGMIFVDYFVTIGALE